MGRTIALLFVNVHDLMVVLVSVSAHTVPPFICIRKASSYVVDASCDQDFKFAMHAACTVARMFANVLEVMINMFVL